MKVIWWQSLCFDKTYLALKSFFMKVRVVEIVKEVKRSDSLWRFACGDVYLILHFQVRYAAEEGGLRILQAAQNTFYIPS